MTTARARQSAVIRRAAATLAALLGVVGPAMLLAGCRDADRSVASAVAPDRPLLTPASGSVSTLLGRAALNEGFSLRREAPGWAMDIEAWPGLDVAVQRIDFPSGSHSGWHMHPAPVFIQVVSGTMTFYESDDPHCTPIVRHAGQVYLDAGDHAHIARNENPYHPAQNIVTYFAPPGAALRIDAPAPGNCPF